MQYLDISHARASLAAEFPTDKPHSAYKLMEHLFDTFEQEMTPEFMQYFHHKTEYTYKCPKGHSFVQDTYDFMFDL